MPAGVRTGPPVQFFWAEPDPKITSQLILELADDLSDFTEPLLAAGTLVRADMRERFKTGTDPSHRPWEDWASPPWRTDYRSWAEKHTTGPIFQDRANLHLSGDMERAVLSPSNWSVEGSGLFLDTGDLPDYWAWNNFGAERKAFTADGEMVPNDLPERPFVGISPEGQAGIRAIFDAWFEGKVAVGVSPKGKKHFRHAEMGIHPRTGKYGFIPASYK